MNSLAVRLFFSATVWIILTLLSAGLLLSDLNKRNNLEAFDDRLILNKEAKERLEKHYSDDLFTKARLKMAYLPSKAKLIDNPVSIAPGFFIENIFVFPGVPRILEIMLIMIVANQ